MAGDTNLRRIYAEVCRGYSEARYLDEPIFVKHLTIFDQTEIDSLREEAFEAAAKRGMLTEEQKLKWLETKGLWTKKEELELAMQRGYVENLEKTRSTRSLAWQIKQVDGQLVGARNKLHELTGKRIRLVGLTTEQVADQKVQYEYMRLSFFGELAMKTPLFARDDLNALDDQTVETLLSIYIRAVTQFSPENLRKIAIAPFFVNYFYLCGDDIKSFFGKPIVDLTYYQTNILSYGQYFKSIMTQNDVPKEHADDPDKIEDYIRRSRNMRTMMAKTDANADRVALIGATSQDIKDLGLNDGSAQIQEEMKGGFKSGMEAARQRGVTYTN